VKPGVIWLLAVGYHREGDSNDAYTHFAALKAAGRLLPDRDDLVAYLRSQAPNLARSLIQDVPDLVAAAKDHPRQVQVGVIGERIRIRVVYEDSDPPMMTVAISQKLWPGEMDVPADWQIRVAAAFLPETPVDQLSLAFDLAGVDLESDEIALLRFLRYLSAEWTLVRVRGRAVSADRVYSLDLASESRPADKDKRERSRF
jgi:hypothetical protein